MHMNINRYYSSLIRPVFWSCASALAGTAIQYAFQLCPQKEQDESPSLCSYSWSLLPAGLAITVAFLHGCKVKVMRASTCDDYEREWIHKRLKEDPETNAKLSDVFSDTLLVLSTYNPEFKAAFQMIQKTVTMHSACKHLDAFAYALQLMVKQIHDHIQSHHLQWLNLSKNLEKQVTAFTMQYYMYCVKYLISCKTDTIAVEQPVNEKTITKHYMDFLILLVKVEKEIVSYIDKQSQRKVSERKTEKVSSARSLVLELQSLGQVLKFVFACAMGKRGVLMLLGCPWGHSQLFTPSRELVCADWLKFASYWQARIEYMRGQSLVYNNETFFEDLPRLFNQAFNKNGHFQTNKLLELEKTLITTSAALNANLFASNYALSLLRIQPFETVVKIYQECCPTSISEPKTKLEFEKLLRESLIIIIIQKNAFEVLFTILEKELVNLPNRFSINPSASRFIDLIAEGRALFENSWTIPEMQAPASLIPFRFNEWIDKTTTLHKEELDDLRFLNKNGMASLNLIPDLCEMAKNPETFNGLVWLRMSLTTNIIKKRLDAWLKKWADLNTKYEQMVIDHLKKLPEDEKLAYIDQIGEWMHEQKMKLKPMIDIFCLGNWIEHLAIDSLNPQSQNDDFSRFFPAALKRILDSFDPETLLRKTTSKKRRVEKPIQSYSAPQTQSPQVRVAQSLPPSRSTPKIKRRGQARATIQQEIPEEIEEIEEKNAVVYWKAGIKTRKLLSDLYGLGFELVSQHGSHMKLVLDDRTVIVPDHPQIKRGTLHSIAEQAGVSAILQK